QLSRRGKDGEGGKGEGGGGLREGESGGSVRVVDLFDRVDVGGSTDVQAEVVLSGRADDGLSRASHRVLQARVHNVLLGRTVDAVLEGLVGRDVHLQVEGLGNGVLDRLEQMLVGVTLVLEGETTVRDVVQVLEPLEEGDSHTTRVDVHVRDDEAVSTREKDLVGSGGDGTVGGLGDHLSLDASGVALVDRLFASRGDENVALLEHEVGEGREVLGSGESLDGSLLVLPVLELLGVDAVGVEQSAVPLLHSHALGSGSVKVSHGVESDVSESLDDEGLAGEAGRESDVLHIVGVVHEHLQSLPHSSSGGGGAPVDASRHYRLARDAGGGVLLLVADGLGVRVGDPGHLPLSGSHVRGGHVDAGAEEALLREFDGDATGDLLDLVLRVLLGVDLHSSLGSSEGHVHNRALVGHQGGQGLHLILADVHRVADASLGGGTVLGVLRSPGLDDLELAIVTADGERDVEDLVHWLDGGENALDEVLLLGRGHGVRLELLDELGSEHLASLVEEVVNHLEERGVELLLHGLLGVDDLGVGIERGRREGARVGGEARHSGASERRQHG
ncbi:hypothetical protein PENTCL1PPCAC_19979, partial [Pristionchus entomophagus]